MTIMNLTMFFLLIKRHCLYIYKFENFLSYNLKDKYESTCHTSRLFIFCSLMKKCDLLEFKII